MNEFERQCAERREFPTRTFALFEPDTGKIIQCGTAQIPPQTPGLITAVFEGIDYSLVLGKYRVDLRSVREVEGDHPRCELVPITQLDS